MKSVLTIIVCMVVVSPCLLILNESGNFMPNLVGFMWLVVLCIVGRTKVGKMALYRLVKANKNIERIIFK